MLSHVNMLQEATDNVSMTRSIDIIRATIAEYREGLRARELGAGDLINWCGSLYFVLMKDLTGFAPGTAKFYLFDLATGMIIERDLEKLICCEKLFDYSLSAR
jgi:hypothetical protein